MNRKLIPVFVTLFAGAIASILMAVNHYTLKSMLSILLVVLLLFYILGGILKTILDHIAAQQEKEREQEETKDGEVTLKDSVSGADAGEASDSLEEEKNTPKAEK